MNTNYIYEYWGRVELVRRMIESNCISESDLLFLMPNNVKKMHGLPMTRISAKRKSKYKRLRKRQILLYKSYKVLEEIIEETMPKLAGEFIDRLVDIKNVSIGDKCDFVC